MFGRCHRYERQLPAAADRDGPADIVLYQHLRVCPSCRAQLHEYRSVRRAMGTLEFGRVDPTDTAVRPRIRERAALAGGGVTAIFAVFAAGRFARRALAR